MYCIKSILIKLMKKYVLIILASLPGYTLMAQMDHYWSWHFNTKSALASGAVVGGPADVSSIYYNPALIARTTESQLAVSPSLFTIDGINYENAFGQGLHAVKPLFQVQTPFISYTRNTKNDTKLEFSYFTNNSDMLNLTFNHSSEIDILSQSDGVESYNGEVQFRKDYVDRWFGLGISKIVSDKISLGLSTFVSVKDLRYELEQTLRAFSESDSVIIDGISQVGYVAAYTDRELIRSFEGRLLFKGGIHFQGDNWGFGLTIRSPSIHIAGVSGTKKEVSRINIYNPSDGSPAVDSAYVSYLDYQDGEKIKLKDPFSVSFGFEYDHPRNKNSILFSLEYFYAIDAYKLTNVSTENVQATNKAAVNFGDPYQNLYHGANQVLNVAFGYHFYINKSVSTYTGLRTDFSSMKQFNKENESLRTISNINSDAYHFTIGAEFRIKKADFVIGLQYTRAREENQPQIINLSNPLEYIPETGEALQGIRTDTMQIKQNAIGLFIGLTFNILTGQGS
jgi:hypothetical protein